MSSLLWEFQHCALQRDLHRSGRIVDSEVVQLFADNSCLAKGLLAAFEFTLGP
jgi:hypothetical protein